MNCPACESTNVGHETNALCYSGDGCVHAAAAITGYFCQRCGTMFPEHRQLTKVVRAERRKGLRNLMGLNEYREGGPIDGLVFQLALRAEW